MYCTLEDFEFSKVRDFSEYISDYRFGDTPIVVEMSPVEIRVGKFYLHRIDDGVWRTLDTLTDAIVDFCNKKNAMFYALFMSRNYVNQASQLRKLDGSLAKLQNDIELLQYQISEAKKIKDSWLLDLYEARLTSARDKYKNARAQIKKWFNRAKYYKIQELEL